VAACGYAGIYCNLSEANSVLNYNELSQDYDFWLAYWGTEMPSRNKYGNYGMWQFGGNTNLIRSNIIGGVITDQDYAYKDYPEIMINQNLNNFTEENEVDIPTPTPNDEPDEDIPVDDEDDFFDVVINFFKRIIDYITSLFRN